MCAKGDSDTDTESETSSSSLSSSDEESCDDAAFAEDHQQAVVTKGFLLNRMSRCVALFEHGACTTCHVFLVALRAACSVAVCDRFHLCLVPRWGL